MRTWHTVSAVGNCFHLFGFQLIACTPVAVLYLCLQQFIIQNSKKSWGYTSAAKKLRSAGPVHETKGRGKQEDAYAVQKDMEIQEAHRLLTGFSLPIF